MFGSSNTSSGFGSGFGAKPSGFGSSTPQNNNTSGGLFGNNKPSPGFSFGSGQTNNATSGFGSNNATNPLSANKPPTGGLFGNAGSSTSGTGSGLFGSNKNTASTGQTGGGLFGNNNNTNNQSSGGLFSNSNSAAQNSNTGGGMFGNSSNNNNSNTNAGGLFGNSSNSNTSSGGLFGNASNTNNASKPAGLFGNTAQNSGSSLFGNSSSTSQATKPSFLGGNSNTQPSSGLFGSNNTASAPGSSLFTGSNSGQLNQLTPAKQYNFKDLPKSITESAKASKHPLNNNIATRKRTLSNSSGSSVSAPQGQRSGILERLSTRFSTLKSQARYDSEGLFSPKKDILHSVVPSENQDSSSTKLFVRPFSTTTHNPRSSTNATRRRILTTEYLKLKVDPTRSESRRLKIFGETGGAKKIRVLGRDDENTIDWEVNGSVVSNVDEPVQTKINEKDELIEETNGVVEKNVEPVSEDIKNAAGDDEYWCSPSIDELAKLQLRQLAELQDFTIGRKGYGSISFDLPVDLTAFWSDLRGYLFGNVVKFNKNRTVEVYPNDKIPLGSGLNVPATITLEKCFPVSRRARNSKPEDKTTKDLELRLFIRKLKEFKDMEFVTYDPFSGAWTFRVKHFSIWGLVNEDDEVVDIDSEIEALKQTQEIEAKREAVEPTVDPFKSTLSNVQKPNVFKSRNLAEDTFLFKKQKIDNSLDFDTTDLMPGSFISGQTYDLIRTQQENPEDDNGVQSPILSEDDASVINRDEDDIVPASLSRGDESFIYGEDEDSVNEDRDILDEKQYEPVEVNQDDFQQLEVDPKLAVSDDWGEQLKLSARVDSAYAKDASKKSKHIIRTLSKGLTPGDLDNLIYGDFQKIIKAQKKIKKELRLANHNFSHFTGEAKLLVKDLDSVSFVKEKPLDNAFENINKETLKAIHQKHLNLSKIMTRPNKLPKVIRNPDLTFEFIVDAFKGDSKNKEKSIWTLSSILFDTKNLLTAELSQIDDTDVVNRVVEVKRREKLVQWIKNEIELEVKLKIQNTDDFSEQIFLHLVIFDIASASKQSINTSNPYLSVLISLLGSNDPNVKYSAAQQIQEWKKNAVLQTIPRGILKIYYLLKGDVLTKDPVTKLSEGLSWKARLGLSLFYGDTSESIANSISAFVASNPSDIQGEDEIHFNLLKLFVNKTNDKYPISSIISALKPTKILDVRFQWYIYEILIRSTEQLNFKRSVEFGDQLVLLFAEQLQASESWEEALFVLAHLNNDHAAEHHVKSLLSRKIEEFNKDPFLIERLVGKLQIPKSLISEANALYSRYIGNHWDEASFLLDAGKYEDAHRTIVDNVAPLAVINNGPQLDKLEELIRRFPKSKHIANWNVGLEIYKNYLDLKKKDTDKSLKFLADNLQSLAQTSFHIKVAARLIAKAVAEKITYNAEIKDAKIPVKQILRLPLGEGESQFYAAPLVLKEVKGRFLKGA